MTRELVGMSGVLLLFAGYFCFEAAHPKVAANGATADSTVSFLTDIFTSHHLDIAAVLFVVMGVICHIVMFVTTGKDGRVVCRWSKKNQPTDQLKHAEDQRAKKE